MHGGLLCALAFEQVDARAAKVVELKFFGGLETEEIAELLGLGSATVKRDWALARALALSRVGSIQAGDAGLQVVDGQGRPMDLQRGFDHFAP